MLLICGTALNLVQVEEVLERVFCMKDPEFKGIQPRECAPPVVPTH